MEKMNKLSLPITILIAAIILGGFYFASELNKQKSIEKQQQAALQAKNEELIQQKEQHDRDFDASQKEACLAIYKQESSKWNNVDGWRYDAEHNTCYVDYKQNPKKTKAECDNEYKDADGKVMPLFFTDYLLCQEGLFQKSF